MLRYTVTVTNTGKATGSVSREDVLTDVLDDADLMSEPESDTDSVTVSAVVDGRFSLGGELAAGATATVTYEVTVRAAADRGNHIANNFLVPPGATPPEQCADDSTECTSTPMPVIDAVKSVNPESGEAVAPGQNVTYTLTFSNTGNAAGRVSYVDDLAGVVDDASLAAGPTFGPSLDAELTSDDLLLIEGQLDAGETEEVTYTVTVLPDGQRGDNVLGNILAPSNAEDPQCGDVGVTCTQNPVPLLTQWKSVSASESPVAAGTVLTYTLFFANDGEAAATVDSVDDLTHVLDDADVVVEPSSDVLTVSREGVRISVTGSVDPGETASVSYEVVVRADGERGDDLAANFLMVNDPENPPVVPEVPTCQPADAELPDCTSTPIGRILMSKAVSASTDPVGEGTVLTYTLTFDNQGEANAVVDHEDVLSDVLDDATLTDAPAASSPALSVSEVVDERFSVEGDLEAGATVTVTYSVTVNAADMRGNNVANNYLVPAGEEPPTECAEDSVLCTSTPLPLLAVSKSADPASGTAVEAGQEITYTLSFTNEGEASGEVDFSDDLSGVLDDAALTATAESDSPTLVASTGTNGTVRVTGMLAPGATVTVTYVVTVNPDGERGDNMLRNLVAATGTEDPDCADPGVACTEHPVGELMAWKTVDPASGTSLAPGAEATYTLHFENVGRAPVGVDMADDLSGVLDDAEITAAATVSSAALSVSPIVDGRMSIEGVLPASDYVTVTYSVTVKPDGARGDDRLGNFLLDADQPTPEECVDASVERPRCTINYVSMISVVKSSDPVSGTEIIPGERVTYTLTFTNGAREEGAPAVEIDYTDHMADVLDDATLLDGPTATDPLRAETVDDTIRVTGELASGASATVTYAVVAKDYDQQGNHLLGNVIAVTGETPVCAEDSPLCTEHPLVPVPPLPATGLDSSVGAVGLAGALALIGLTVVLLARRKRNETDVQSV